MAKKTDLTTLELSGTLDMGDVISVVTSRAETKLGQELTEAKARLTDAEKEQTDLRKSITSKRKAETQKVGSELAEKVREALKGTEAKVSVEKYCEHSSHNDNGDLQRNIKIGSPYNCTCVAATAKPSPELVDLESQVAAAEEKVSERKEEAMKARRRLASLPTLERQTRAKLAEAKLSESEGGQQVLELLTEDLDDAIKALPSC